MPIDARIPLGVGQGVTPIQSPVEVMSQVAQLQAIREQTEARRAAAEEARQKAKDAAAVRQIWAEANGDPEVALPRMRQIAPKVAYEIETEIQRARKEGVDALRTQTDYRSKQLDLGLKVWQSVSDDASLKIARPMLLALSPDLAQMLPETFDPARHQQILDMALSAKDLAERRQNSLKLLTEGKAAEGVGGWLSTVKSQEEWDGVLNSAVKLGLPREIVQMFPREFSPENAARAAQIAIAPKDRAMIAATAARDAQTEAHQREQEAIARGQLAVSQGNLGVARTREAREAATPGAVKLSAAQQEDLATMLTVEELVQDIQATDKTKGLPGVGPIEGRFFASARGSGGTTGETLRNQIGNIQGTIAKLRGGTSFTPSEQALLDTYTPTTTDTDAAIRTKLKSLADFIQKKRANTLRVARGEYTLPADTKPTDPMGIR